MRSKPLAALVFLLLAAACRTRTRESAPPVTAAAPALVAAPPAEAPPEITAETSVKPDTNKEFLKEDLDVQQWMDRFEKGGRDIFDKRHEILTITGVKPGMAVGDIGSGTGLFTMLFADVVGPTGKVYAVDIARPFIDLVTKRAAQRGAKQIVPVLSTARSTELAAASIDLAFICDVYHHFEYPKSMLASLARALRPGGTIVLIDFKREVGKSSAWTLEHVRAGEDVFTAEIEAAGFTRLSSHDILKDNYVLRFKKR